MKRWYESKTIWTNLLGGGATIITIFAADFDLTADQQASLVAAVMVVVNICLRLTTKKGIK